MQIRSRRTPVHICIDVNRTYIVLELIHTEQC